MRAPGSATRAQRPFADSTRPRAWTVVATRSFSLSPSGSTRAPYHALCLHYVNGQCDDPAVRFIVTLGALGFGAIMGCQAHVQASANVNGSAEANGEPESANAWDMTSPVPSAEGSSPPATGELAMLGARSDLS